jgi:hypothetical protein
MSFSRHSFQYTRAWHFSNEEGHGISVNKGRHFSNEESKGMAFQ